MMNPLLNEGDYYPAHTLIIKECRNINQGSYK